MVLLNGSYYLLNTSLTKKKMARIFPRLSSSHYTQAERGRGGSLPALTWETSILIMCTIDDWSAVNLVNTAVALQIRPRIRKNDCQDLVDKQCRSKPTISRVWVRGSATHSGMFPFPHKPAADTGFEWLQFQQWFSGPCGMCKGNVQVSKPI